MYILYIYNIHICSPTHCREVTNGQELEEVDISVHCDIKIFDWLMCWIKYDNPKVGNGLLII